MVQRETCYSHVSVKLELEEVVGDLGSALSREDKHLVSAHGHREVTAGRRDLTTLLNLGTAGQHNGIPYYFSSPAKMASTC